jgi:acetylornithine deacetylase/succinyl-diaminopimelate desuccinylase-like protein
MFYKKWFEEKKQKNLEELFTFLSIPSVSADSMFKEDLLQAAAFIENRLKKLNMKVSVWNEAKAPVIFGERLVDPSFPTVLIYGHYDVQPADPLNLWDSPPFSPQIRDGRIYARGAEDNKGQNFYTLLAIEAFYEKHVNPKINIKVIIEGGEEIGSPGFDLVVKAHKKELKADSVWIVDSGIGSYKNPELSLGARGISALEVTFSNAEFDLHSGSYGGAVYNPIRALCEVLCKVHDTDGNIVIEGFFDGANYLTKEQKSKVNFSDDKEEFYQETKASCFIHHKGRTLQESVGIHPTFEINGIYGGYMGEGSKTIIPKQATAKITCRLIAGQNPASVAEKVKIFIEKNAPEGMKVDVRYDHGGNAAWAKPENYTTVVFQKILSEHFGKNCKLAYMGGSIPITSTLAECSGGEYIFLGTALPEDRIHAPNESFSLKQLEDGFILIAKGLEVFAENKNRC